MADRAPALRDLALNVLERLKDGEFHEPRFAEDGLAVTTSLVPMRDGTKLATDIHRPPLKRAPTIVLRTPYGRDRPLLRSAIGALCGHGFVVVAQDCRGTGDSEPQSWDYYLFEPDDSYDLVAWISTQAWYDGFIGGCGGSYAGQTQWCMAMHPAMSAIAPEVSGLGIAGHWANLHMFVNAYARSIGKGHKKLDMPLAALEKLMVSETLAGGIFNDAIAGDLPQVVVDRFPDIAGLSPSAARSRLWNSYCGLSCAERAAFLKAVFSGDAVTMIDIERSPALFGRTIPHDAHTLPHEHPADAFRALKAPALMITGWYDWGLNDALASWSALQALAPLEVRERSRLLISPSAHNAPGYKEALETHPLLGLEFRTQNIVPLLCLWNDSVREEKLEDWPPVIYYMMGANEWRTSDAWPPRGESLTLFLRADASLSTDAPAAGEPSRSYIYDPLDPTPTAGGSIVSVVIPPGSVDVSGVQARDDVLTFTTAPLDADLEIAGPLSVDLFASSSAIDTDFAVRLSDVFPDGRAIQIQSGLLRARYRNGDEQALEPDKVYSLLVDLWATANCFRKGHRIRIDIASADFPRFDRNSNLGGEPGTSIAAKQTIYCDRERPSRLMMNALEPSSKAGKAAGER